uniref:Uncharacterized protein n=1 Tax=Ralstonia phage BOESR1 TaxID=3034917 RepID=A0AA50F2S8_9CAUD|nr:hypothetical protein HIBIKMCM_00011 [Ralstonia phage BOESR1]
MKDREQRLEWMRDKFGEQETDLIGKRIRTLDDNNEPFTKKGDIGTVVLVDDLGEIWADFGPDGYNFDGHAHPIWACANVGTPGSHEIVED